MSNCEFNSLLVARSAMTSMLTLQTAWLQKPTMLKRIVTSEISIRAVYVCIVVQ
jgi:hypothetical protein